MANFQLIDNLTQFILTKTGTIWGTWSGKLTAVEQRALLGRYIGKGTIVINSFEETVCNRVKVCFGQDWDDRNVTKWSAL
jgi:hypothetical protein